MLTFKFLKRTRFTRYAFFSYIMNKKIKGKLPPSKAIIENGVCQQCLGTRRIWVPYHVQEETVIEGNYWDCACTKLQEPEQIDEE